MSAHDRLHRARGTGSLRINETREGAWYAKRGGSADPDYSRFERWFDFTFMPALEGFGVWIVFPTCCFFALFEIVRWMVTR